VQGLYKQFDLTNKVAVIIGASEGIGRDIAIGLAEAGSDLIICSRREDKLLDVKEAIEKTGRKADIYVMDIRNISEIEGLKAFIKAKTAKVDILINNAGYVVTKPAWDVSEQDWDTMVDTGFKGVFFCCQAIGSLMREQGYGKIINLSSTYSQSVFPGRAVYAGIKAGINHLTEALALEWAPHGIRVNAIAPTAVNTPSRQTTLQGTILEQVLARIPLGRLATSDDLLGAVMYFGSEASDFVTGQTLFIDGGWVAAS
jgi:NAD(P)-dependent dehydrogenase (short-subunit alcohol dehydrogenase family)